MGWSWYTSPVEPPPFVPGPSRRRRSPTARAAAGLLGVVTGGALLAACSSGPPGAVQRPTTTTHAKGTTTTSAASTTTTTVPVAPSACSSGVLHLSEGGLATSAGTSHLTLVLTNEGPRRCTIDGYPGVVLFGSSGAGGSGAGPRLVLTTVRIGAAPRPVSVAPGSSAAFLLSVTEVPVNGVGCEGAASLEVASPGGGGVLSLPVDLEVCGGTIGVYAVTAGS